MKHYTITITSTIRNEVVYTRNTDSRKELVEALADRKAKEYMLPCQVDVKDNWDDTYLTYHAN